MVKQTGEIIVRGRPSRAKGASKGSRPASEKPKNPQGRPKEVLDRSDYKRLTASTRPEVHRAVKLDSARRGMEIKEYILSALVNTYPALEATITGDDMVSKVGRPRA